MVYEAVVCKISTRPHPNADRIQLGTAHGYQVVVGLETSDQELGVFFPADGQLSQEMCDHNDLIGWKDAEGNRRGGFFAKNRRVRSQRFRGEKSEGYWTPLETLGWTKHDLGKLVEGDKFDSLNNKPVCNKYYTPATLRAMKGGTQAKRLNKLFQRHPDTRQLKYEIDSIPSDAIVHITEKVHGTSGRYGFLQDNKKLKWWQKLFKTVPGKEYKYLVGTRNVILEDKTGDKGFYKDETFRWKAAEQLEGNLHKGEIVYGEIVGWVTDDTPVMATQDTSKLPDIQKQYGDTITYTYGQPQGTCKLYVYKISRTNEDGNIVDLSWPATKQRCEELGVEHVPDIEGPFVAKDRDIMTLTEQHTDGPSVLCHTHPREGVVVRVDSGDVSAQFLKAKSFTFGVLEGYIKQDDGYVDLEEIS